MKILFTSEAVVEICNGKYHKTSFNPFIERYRYFGNVIFASYKKDVLISKQSVLNIEGVQFEFFEKENSPLNILRNWGKNRRHMRKCVENADIVVTHLPSPIGMIAIEYAKRYHKPCIVGVVGCAWDACWNYNWKGKLVAIPFYLSMKEAVKQAKYVFYVTQKFLQKRYPNDGITMGCSNVEIQQAPDKVLAKRLESIEKLDFGYTINIVTVAAVNVRYKGQEYVIRALDTLNHKQGFNFHYHLIGGGDNSFLMNLTKKLDLEQYVHFSGPIPHEKIWDYLDKMDVYIQPSRQEGLPRALIEAMSRGLPAFGSRTAGIPELLPEDCLFDNGNVRQITRLLSSLTSDTMKQYANANYEKSLKYTSDVLATRRKSFFDEVLLSIGQQYDSHR